MRFPAGAPLGPYEILAPLGSGGMGEVYRARDPRLERDVAIKVLADTLARDPVSLSRFEREARTLASLEHPNIAVIHGLEEADGMRFLVLELVEGETLAERIAGGPLPVDEALEIARQLAEALEAAHERGIVHRDLKPANVKVTPQGKVKVLDFGLAKNLSPSSAGGSAVMTLEPAETGAGTILGTPAYMSPEQARGRPVDKRADIWAFGCLLYEILSGDRAFGGETASDSLARILTREPDWDRLPRSTPEPIRSLLRRCLEKDVNRRLRDAGDARLEIESVAAGPSARSSRPKRAPSDSPRGGGIRRLLQPFTALFPRAPARLESSPRVLAPKLSQLTFSEGIEGFPAWSPDGKKLAFAREEGSVRRIFVKDIESGQESAVTEGRFDDIQPAWSADASRLLFVRSQEPGRKLEPADVFGQYDGADVWSRELATGREGRLVANAANPAFSPGGDRIAFDASLAGPRRIWISDERGRNLEQATADSSEAVAHVRPRWSPDGRRIVFQNIERTKFDVRVADLESKQLLSVTNDFFQDVCPVWSPAGDFLYFSSYRSGGLNVWRVPVRADGSPSGLLQQLTTGAGQDVEAAFTRDGRRLAVSILRQNADLWRLPVAPETGRPAGPPGKVVASTREDSRGAWSPDAATIAFNSDRAGDMNIWLLRLSDGSIRQLTRGPGGDFQPRFSPDARRIAFFSARGGSPDVWTVEVESGRLDRLTRTSSIDVNPVFSPGGDHIAYMSDSGGRFEVWLMDANGANARRLTDVGVMGHFLAWSSDGGFVVFRCPAGGRPRTLKIPASGGEPEPLAEVVGGAHMSFSADGSRIMDVLAHKTLWVSPLSGGVPERVFEFEDPDGRIDYPLWSPDGRAIFFDRFRPRGGDIWMLENLG